MPNHIHCIVGVNDSKMISDSDDVETGFKPVCTKPVFTTDNMADNFAIENPNKKNHGVFELIRALKSFSSRRINEKRNSRGVSNWQERFHDHIIRNEAELIELEIIS
jgi:putative transposase